MARNQDARLNYIRSLYAAEDNALEKIRKSIPKGKEGIVVGPEEGKLLFLLMQMIGAKKALEIGTFVGYSTTWLARGIKETGQVISIEKIQEYYKIAKDNIRDLAEGDKITLLCGDAVNILKTLEEENGFDAIFIDANKAYYDQYLMHSMKLLRPGGLIIADNTMLFDSIYNDKPTDKNLIPKWEGMKRFNEILADENVFHSVMIPTKEGLSVAIKK